MKKTLRSILFIALSLLAVTEAMAQKGQLAAIKNQVEDGYNFWLYVPYDYSETLEQTPVVIFLHGASLCGNDMNRSRRYGPLHALNMGREIPAMIITPQNPGG